MDFSYLLELAKANEEKNKKDNSVKFSTKVSSAKKESKPGPKAKAINQLLNKIEDEKKQKSEEYNKKRNELLALRANDKHSKKRVHSLINRTKGASKAVLEDAKDLTTAKGEEQCDEDDYGYESTLSQQIFSKLQTTYSELPDDERLKFHKTEKSSIEDIKNRVMSSLKQKQEEELGIRKRKRNRKSKKMEEEDGFINDGDEYTKFGNTENVSNAEEKEKKSSKPEKKKHSKYDIDPSLIPQKVDKYSNFKYEKEKRKEEKPTEKHKDKEMRKEEKPTEKHKDKEKKKITKSAPPPMTFEELMKMAQKKQKDPIPIIDPLQEFLEKKKEKEKQKFDESRPLTAKEKKELEEENLRRLKKMGKIPSEKEPAKSKEAKKDPKILQDKNSKEVKEKTAKENKPLPEPPKKVVDRPKCFAVPKSTSDTSSKNAQSVPQSTRTTVAKVKVEKEPPPKMDVKPKKEEDPPRTFPKPTFPRKSAPPRPRPPPPQPKSFKRRIDSDEEDEYDSEMDDFIDDGDGDVDYSNEIAKLFKYDKSKYRDEDDDVDNMEASFSQMQKEEVYSAKMGLKEDLEDIRKEEEEKKRKKMMKKRKL